MTRCECINIKHARRCEKAATRVCEKCGEKLCGHCAREHHVHDETKKLEPSA